MKRFAITSAVLFSSLLSFNLMAAQPSPEEAAENAASTRQAAFKLLAFSNGALGGMARGAPYDAAVAKLATERVAMLADMLPALFEADTSSFTVGGRYMASNTIWTSKADFDQKAMDLSAAAKEAMGILSSKGADGVREAVGLIGQKCGACHDVYRADR